MYGVFVMLIDLRIVNCREYSENRMVVSSEE